MDIVGQFNKFKTYKLTLKTSSVSIFYINLIKCKRTAR